MSNIFIPGQNNFNFGKRLKTNKSTLAKHVDRHFTQVETPVEQTMSKEDLHKLHAAIHYTHAYKQKESYDKMDEEEVIERPIPHVPRL